MGAKRWVEWTNHENAILREIWELPTPVKESMHRLPRHTNVHAVLQHAHEIGLPPRKRGKSEYSAACSVIKKELERAPCHAAALSEITGVSYRRVHELCRVMHAEGKIHITNWRKTERNGPPAPIYAWGEGEDAKRPKPAALRNKLRHKKDASLNPFGQMVAYARQQHREAA